MPRQRPFSKPQAPPPAAGPSPPRSPGRPRSEAAREAVLTAGYRLLRDHGLAGVSAQEVAAAAGVSTATLYRWWPTKEAVLFDAFFAAAGRTLPFAAGGRPLERLRDHAVRGAAWLTSPDGRVMAQLILTVQGDEALRRQFLDRFYLPRRAAARTVVEEAVAAGELPPGTDPEVVIDAVYGPQYFRLLVGHAPLTPAFAAAVFDQVVGRPLRRAKPG